ncbi:DUF4388 domain-containing protein [Deferribacter thermophilus]|uniref:DUF4388 domain-containing protein n=1 Tax=Deferribacter thermophilus TaxID=53573 RepID=UPI003C1ED446
MAFSSQLIGDLKSMSVPDIYQWVANSKRTGYVFFQRGTEEVKAYFDKGDLINITSNIPDFLLGSLLIRYKKIDKKTLATCLKLQIKTKEPLGQLLVQKGFISKEDLNFILKQQMIELTTYLLEWEKGFFFFDEVSKSFKHFIAIKIDEILFEAIRRKDELALYRKVLSEKDIIKLNTSEQEYSSLANVIDGKKSVHEIIYELGGDYVDNYKLLYELFLNKKLIKVGTKEDIYNPSVTFLLALELFGKGKIYDSYIQIKSLYDKYPEGLTIKNFYQNLVVHVDKLFEKTFGGENACFKVNNLKLLDQKIYLTPKDGYVVSRIAEEPCFDDLKKVCNLEKTELKLILLKLYKMGVVLLKDIKKKETKELSEDSVVAILDVIKNEMTGALEIITEEFKANMFFENGKCKICYSQSEKFHICKYIEKITNKSLNTDDFYKLINSVIEKEIIKIVELEKILEMYSLVLVGEIVKSKSISNIFVYNDLFGYDLKLNINLLYLIVFALNDVERELDIQFDLGQYYELTVKVEEILEIFEDYIVIKNLLNKFEDNLIEPSTIRNCSLYEINILKILYYLEYLKPAGIHSLTVEELKNYLAEIQNKTPFEIFEINKESYSIDVVKKKYVDFTKKFHPDLFDDNDRKSLAKEIFGIIKEGFDYLVTHEKVEESKPRIDAKRIFLAEQLLASGKVYLNMGRITDACEAFIKAYENFNMDEEIKAYYGLALIKKGDFANGFEILDNTKFYNFNDPNLYYAYLDAAMRLRKLEKAKKVLKKFESEFKSLSHKADFYKRKLGY